MTPRGPLVLIVIDGFGIAPPGPGNAVHLARTPHLDALAAEASGTRIAASGLPVGLPDGQQGNSEVGHLNLGAGRRVPQMLVRIDEAIADGSMARLPALGAAMETGRRTTLHLVGLVGEGGVHASQRHALALIDIARAEGVERVVVHARPPARASAPSAAATGRWTATGAGIAPSGPTTRWSTGSASTGRAPRRPCRPRMRWASRTSSSSRR
jgi:2,3-bisphosphoglycerate-independent phosphoglycerate mutase